MLNDARELIQRKKLGCYRENFVLTYWRERRTQSWGFPPTLGKTSIMEQKLIDAMAILTEAINNLNTTLSKPLDVHTEVYNTAVELKHKLEDLKNSVDKLNDTMTE